MLMKLFVLGLLLGVSIPYILQSLDLLIGYLTNKYTLNATKVQKQIDELIPPQQEYEVKEPCVGFKLQEPKEEEYSEDKK